MRADYESQVDTFEITLRDVERLDHAHQHGDPVVHFEGGAPALIDILSSADLDETIAMVAKLYGLDGGALLAAARAALAAPDRPVTVEVAARFSAWRRRVQRALNPRASGARRVYFTIANCTSA